jgi:type IV secretion system protein TrbI
VSSPSRDPQGLEPPRPHGIVRLSRRGLWALGIIMVSVAVSGLVALQAQDRKRRERRSTTIPAPPPEARWYQQQSDALFKPVAVPAAEPTPFGAPTPSLRLVPKEPQKDPMEMRREQAYMRALDSKALVSEFKNSASRGGGEAGSRAPAAPGELASHAALDRLRDGLSGASTPDDQNLQSRKEDFLDLDREGETLSSIVRPGVSPHEVKAGSVIPAILIAGMNSDLPGQTIAQVRENVFDTPTGAHLLLPQGTRIVGLYDSHVAYGQQRVLVNWKRLIFPNGTSLSLEDGMPGADAAGYAGFSDKVDNHLFELFGRAVLLSAITAGVELSQRGFNDRDRGVGLSAADVASASLGQNLGQVAVEVVRRGLNRQPTLIVRPGYRFNIMVTQDLVLPGPYVDDLKEKE